MDKSTRDEIKKKVQKLIDEKIFKNEDELKDIELDKVGDLAQKLDVCPKNLIAYIICGGDCENCNVEYKGEFCRK